MANKVLHHRKCVEPGTRYSVPEIRVVRTNLKRSLQGLTGQFSSTLIKLNLLWPTRRVNSNKEL